MGFNRPGFRTVSNWGERLSPTPEQLAREQIDAALVAAGWLVQDFKDLNIEAGPGVAVREFPLASGYGHADYLLYVGGKAAGIIEAKEAGVPLTGVEVQAEKYAKGVPKGVPAHLRPLPFLYQSTGVETRFTNLLDPEPRSRRVFSFHRPETFAEWLAEDPLWLPLKKGKPDPKSSAAFSSPKGSGKEGIVQFRRIITASPRRARARMRRRSMAECPGQRSTTGPGPSRRRRSWYGRRHGRRAGTGRRSHACVFSSTGRGVERRA